jgi:hypothetical protein
MGVLSKGITLGFAIPNYTYVHRIVGEAEDGNPCEYEIITTKEVLTTADFQDGSAWANAYLIDEASGEKRQVTFVEDMGYSVLSNGTFNYSSQYTDTIIGKTPVGGGNMTTLTNLQEIAELGNNAKEKIDITVLSDDAKKSMDGLSDTAQDLPFKFLYEKEQFNTLAALEGEYAWCVTLPDGMTATFTASPSVKLAGAGVSAALTYTLTLSVMSEITFA